MDNTSSTSESTEQTEVTPSDEICRRAIEVYDGLYDRTEMLDGPDLHLDIRHASGRRAIETRAEAGFYDVNGQMRESAEVVLRLAAAAEGEAALDWLDKFPTAFLDSIDRRGGPTVPARTGQRFVDRIARAYGDSSVTGRDATEGQPVADDIHDLGAASQD